jgi:signal transduction histidine kinase/CheY-like chemotaxis protein
MAAADAYPFPTLTPAVRFGIAIAGVLVVFVMDRALGRLMDEGSLFLLLSLAVIGSAWFAGTGPALAATVAGTVLGAFTSPAGDNPAAHTKLALFVIQGLVLTGIISELRRARRLAELEAGIARAATGEAESASRMKDEFLATISHELRTPLNAVLGWVYLLRTGKLDTQTAARGLESIERNARLQTQLTTNLLDISKALTGRLHIEPRPVRLDDVAREAVLSATAAANAKGVRIASHGPDAPVPVLGDGSRLRQVVWQMIANALKFTPRNGTIQVIVRTEHDQAVIEVFDSGPGIDPEFLPRVFDRFTQEDASATRSTGGMGVGLSLVRELVELHGGSITAANRSDGTGAVFTARFPLQPSALLSKPVPETREFAVRGAPPLDGIRALVLDRDSETRELVRTVLQQHGAAVQTTDSVGEALEALESWRPDVLVSDGGSPEHDFYSVFGKLRSLESERGGRIPALALTNLARTDQHVRDMFAACLVDVPKPVEPALLAAEVARLTGRERRRAAR